MKSLFKITLLASTLALTLSTTQTLAAEEIAKEPVKPTLDSHFKNTEQQTAYALGASLASYMENAFAEQKKLGIYTLDKDQIIAGVRDAFANENKLSDEEVGKTLEGFEAQVKAAANVKMAQEAAKNAEIAKKNAVQGDEYRDSFAKKSDVKKMASGLLYKIERSGTGVTPKDSDTVKVNYKGTLIDGTEFDNSYKRGEATSFRLDSVIVGWQEGLKKLKKGGKITLVIPPSLAYGKNGVPGSIPAGSTLMFEVELLDVLPAKTVEPVKKEEAKVKEKSVATTE